MGTVLVDAVAVVTGRALRYGLGPGMDPDRAAAGLVELAHGEASLLQRAIGRLEQGLEPQTSRAGQRARAMLERALTLVGTCGGTVLVLVYSTPQKTMARVSR